MRTADSNPTTNEPSTEANTSTTPTIAITSAQTQSPTTYPTPETMNSRSSTESTRPSEANVSTEHKWPTYILQRYRSLPRYSRLLFNLSLSASVAQILAIICVLSVTTSQTCESLFRIYLTASAVRLFLTLPIVGVYYLHPEGYNIHCPTTPFLCWVSRIRAILNFSRTMLFFFGNYVIFVSLVCASGSPGLYGMAIALVAFGYLRVIVPGILCIAVICVPCLIVVLRALNLAEVLETGANLESISKLNIVRYRKSKPDQESQDTAAEVTHGVGSTKSKNRPNPFTRMLLKVFRRNKSKASSHQDPDLEKGKVEDTLKVVQLSDEDAVCCICLEEYVDGENLREMRCAHYFHVSCIDEWLQLNRTCPLCKRDIEFTNAETNT